MEMWSEIRRKVLVEGVSKRSIRRDYRVGSETLENALRPGWMPSRWRAVSICATCLNP